MHNHDDYKVTNNGVYPGGQLTMIQADAPDKIHPMDLPNTLSTQEDSNTEPTKNGFTPQKSVNPMYSTRFGQIKSGWSSLYRKNHLFQKNDAKINFSSIYSADTKV